MNEEAANALQQLRAQEIAQHGPMARDMLFVQEHPRLPGGDFAQETTTSVVVNLGQVLDTPERIHQYMHHLPQEGPGSGKRLRGQLHLYLPTRRADLVILMEVGKDQAQLALVTEDGQRQPPDDTAFAELSLIERLRAVRLGLAGVGEIREAAAGLALLKEAAQMAPGYPLLPDMLGMWAKAHQQWDEGVALARELAAHQPAAALALADLLDEKGETQQALTEVNHLLVNPDMPAFLRPVALNMSGYLLRRLNRLVESVQTLEQVVAETPDFEPAWGNLVAALIEHGQVARAMEHTQSAVNRFGLQNPVALQLNDGAAADLLARVPPHEAEPLIRQFCQITPGVLHALCGAYAELQATAAAEERLHELLEQWPDDARAHYNLGILSEDPQELLRRCHMALACDPTYNPARLALPQALVEATGRQQDLVAAKAEVTTTYHTASGAEATVRGVPMTYELVFSHLWESPAPLSLENDEHLHRLLIAKGHNRRFETGQEEKYMEILVNQPPGEGVLALAGAVAWVTPEGEEVASAPVAITLVDETGEQREPLVSPHEEMVQLHRAPACEPADGGEFDWPHGGAAPG